MAILKSGLAVALGAFVLVFSTLVVLNPSSISPMERSLLTTPSVTSAAGDNLPTKEASTNNSADANADTQEEAHIVGKRILVGIPSFGRKQFMYLEDMIDSFRDLCETGADITIFIYTTEPYSIEQVNLFNSRTHCYHPTGNLFINIKIKPPSSQLRFVDFHRKDFYDNLDNFDLFIYSEDDHHIRPSHVIAYLYETAKLKKIVGLSSFPNYSIGFLRYEHNKHTLERFTFDQYEYKDAGLHSFENPVLKHKYIGNRRMPHQGMFMATSEQLKLWRDRCHFDQIDPDDVEKGRGKIENGATDVDTPIWHREFVSSLRLFANEGIRINCQVTQLFPASDQFENFMLHHMPDKYYDNPNFEKGNSLSARELQNFRLRLNKKDVEKNNVDDGADKQQQHTMTHDHVDCDGMYNGVVMELLPEDRDVIAKSDPRKLDMIIAGMEPYHSYVKNRGQMNHL